MNATVPPPGPPLPPLPPLSPMPVGASRWEFPDLGAADNQGFVGLGADLEPSTLIAAYQHGMFPMPAGLPNDGGGDDGDVMGWWSPDPRGILAADDLHVSRSLRRSLRQFEVSVDHAFGDVIRECARLPRPGSWISPAIITAYERLHQLGWAHSVEVWHHAELVGGVYGIQIGGFFAGESMFRLRTDASKTALVALVGSLRQVGVTLFDVQWETEHLATLGACSVTKTDYLAMLAQATTVTAESLAVLAHRSLTPALRSLDRVR